MHYEFIRNLTHPHKVWVVEVEIERHPVSYCKTFCKTIIETLPLKDAIAKYGYCEVK